MRRRWACGGRLAGLRRQAEAADPAARLVLVGRAERALPAGVDALDQAARRVRVDQLACVASPSGRRSAISASAARSSRSARKAPRSARASVRGRVLEPEVAAGPAHAVGGVELQVAGGELDASGRPCAPASRPVTARSTSGSSSLPSEASTRASARSAAPPTKLAVVDVGPEPQRAAAFADPGVERHIAAEPRDVDVRQVGVDLAVPGLPVAAAHRQQRLAELAAQGEALAPAGRRRGVEPQRMAAAAVAGDELHVGQQQRRGARAARRSSAPCRRARPPRAGRRTSRRHRPSPLVSVDMSRPATCSLPSASRRTSTCGPLDVELLEAQVPERARRHAGHHARQSQRLALARHRAAPRRAVRSVGKQAARAGGDRADAHRHARWSGWPALPARHGSRRFAAQSRRVGLRLTAPAAAMHRSANPTTSAPSQR